MTQTGQSQHVDEEPLSGSERNKIASLMPRYNQRNRNQFLIRVFFLSLVAVTTLLAGCAAFSAAMKRETSMWFK